MAIKYYAAYGSNLNINQMKSRCRNAEIFGTAVLQDYKLAFKGMEGGYYLTIEQAKGKEVPLGIWAVNDSDESSLDIYEGYPEFYSKEDIELSVLDIKSGEEVNLACFIYIMNDEFDYGMPRKSYVEACRQGYDNFGFCFDYIEVALRELE